MSLSPNQPFTFSPVPHPLTPNSGSRSTSRTPSTSTSSSKSYSTNRFPTQQQNNQLIQQHYSLLQFLQLNQYHNQIKDYLQLASSVSSSFSSLTSSSTPLLTNLINLHTQLTISRSAVLPQPPVASSLLLSSSPLCHPHLQRQLEMAVHIKLDRQMIKLEKLVKEMQELYEALQTETNRLEESYWNWINTTLHLQLSDLPHHAAFAFPFPLADPSSSCSPTSLVSSPSDPVAVLQSIGVFAGKSMTFADFVSIASELLCMYRQELTVKYSIFESIRGHIQFDGDVIEMEESGSEGSRNRSSRDKEGLSREVLDVYVSSWLHDTCLNMKRIEMIFKLWTSECESIHKQHVV